MNLMHQTDGKCGWMIPIFKNLNLNISLIGSNFILNGERGDED